VKGIFYKSTKFYTSAANPDVNSVVFDGAHTAAVSDEKLVKAQYYYNIIIYNVSRMIL